jgi:hypothetical protein
MTDDSPQLSDVLRKAAELQRLVPGAVLVGGSAAAFHAGHRRSFDHDHVLTDLDRRFDTILEHLESLGDWSLARASSGKIILGELGGIETGVRQLIRSRALEVETVRIDDLDLVVPTADEMLRIKAWLIVHRNQTRDYLDVAALADHVGLDHAAHVLAMIDQYYSDINQREETVVAQVVRQLSDPRPRDVRTTKELSTYKGLDPRWHEWDEVRRVLRELAAAVVVR